MKKVLLFLAILLSLYFITSLYFLDKGYFLCPIQYKWDMVIRNDSRGEGFFSAKRNGNRLHNGLDLFAEIGTPVLASRSGKIVAVNSNNGMGNYIIVRHPQDIDTIYGHLSETNVIIGQRVRQGQLIGRVGKTGNARFSNIQPHLHFEVRKGGVPQDPLEYLE